MPLSETKTNVNVVHKNTVGVNKTGPKKELTLMESLPERIGFRRRHAGLLVTHVAVSGIEVFLKHHSSILDYLLGRCGKVEGEQSYRKSLDLDLYDMPDE
jgi:hypothetical protein